LRPGTRYGVLSNVKTPEPGWSGSGASEERELKETAGNRQWQIRSWRSACCIEYNNHNGGGIPQPIEFLRDPDPSTGPSAPLADGLERGGFFPVVW
jgi:hypothetical protein